MESRKTEAELGVADRVHSHEKKNVSELWGRGGTKDKVKNESKWINLHLLRMGFWLCRGTQVPTVWCLPLRELPPALASPLQMVFPPRGSPSVLLCTDSSP